MVNPNEQEPQVDKDGVAARPPALPKTGDKTKAPATKAPAGSVVKQKPTVDFLSVFQKSVGSKADPNVTAVGIDFARHLGAIKGSNKSSKTIARSITGGRHSASNGVIQAYAVQSKEMPKNVSSLLDQLDNLAAHSNTVAAMDDTVRVQMIGQGHKELDPAVIAAQENTIMQQLEGLTREVLTAEARLDFQKKQNQTAKSGVDLESSIFEYQSAVADRNQANIDQRADDILDNMTEGELAEALKSGSLPDGLPVAKATSDLQKRVQSRASAVTSLATIDKSSQDSMSRVLGNFSLEVIEELEIIGMQALEEGDITGSVTIPNTEVSVPLTAIRDAKLKRAEIMDKNSKFDVRVVEQNHALIAGYANTANQILEQNLVNPSSLMIIDLQESMARASSVTTAQESREASDNLRKQLDTVITSITATIPESEQKQAFLQRAQNGGRNTYDVASRSFSTREPAEVTTMVAGNQFYTESADFYYHLAAEALGGGGDTAVQDLLGGNKKAPTNEEKLQAVMNDPQTATMLGEVAMGQLTEEVFVAKLDGVFKDMLAKVSDFAFVDADPEAALAIQQQLVSSQRAFFGDQIDSPRIFSNQNNPNLVVPQQVQKFVVNEDGESEAIAMNRQDGTPLTMRVTNPLFMLNQLKSFDTALQDAGYQGPSLIDQFMNNESSAAVDKVVARNLPQNGVQEELLNIISPQYRTLATASSEQILSHAVSSELLKFQTTAVIDHGALAEVGSLAVQARDLGLGNATPVREARKAYIAERMGELTKTGNLHERQTPDGKRIDVDDAEQEFRQQSQQMSIEDLLGAGFLTQDTLISLVTATEGNN